MATKHVRQQIREALVTALTGLTTTGSNVFNGRPEDQELQTTELPALLIDTIEGGDINSLSMGGVSRIIERQLIITITGAVKANSGYLDTLDDIFKEVETALAASVSANTLGGLVKYINPTAEPQVEISGEADKIIARASQPFVAPYITALNSPINAL